MSAKKRGGLGTGLKGLGALIPSAPTGAAESKEGRGTTPSTIPSISAMSTGARGPVDAFFGPTTPPTDSTLESTATPTTGPESGDGPGEPESAPPGLTAVHGATFAELPVAAIHPNAKNPRQVFDEEALAELTHSIREFGVLQPIVVRPDGDEEGAYELVMGERRFRAAQAAGLETIPAIVRTTADDAMLRDALLENIHRVQLNPLEEAAAYQQLLEEFGVTHEELARRLGRSRPQVSNTIRLLNLSVPVQRRVAAGVLSAGHARALLSLPENDNQDDLAARIVAEGLSVRATEELVALHQNGSSPKKSARRPAPQRMSAPAIEDLAAKLSDYFETRARVELGRKKGKITIEFATIDDLERIVAQIAPELASRTVDTSVE